MHIVVAGENELALRITEVLMNEHDVVLVSESQMHAGRLERLDVHVVEGSCSSVTALREARVERAAFFIAASPSDERNIVACIAADKLGAKRRICILSAAMTASAELDDESLAAAVNIDAIIRPAEQLANEILRIVKVPGALDVRSLLGGKIALLKALVEPNSELTTARLAETKLPPDVRLVMVKRGDDVFVPDGSTRLQADDRVTMVGSSRALVKFVRTRCRAQAHGHTKRERRRAIICGGGSVGLRVADGLREAGWWVKIIEQNRQRCEALSGQLNCLVLHGDGSDLELLQEEHVESAAALIAVTNNDEKNLLISLVAKHLGVERIITRADKRVNEHIFEKVGIDVVLSKRGAAVRSVVSDIVKADREHLAELDHGEMVVLDFELPKTFKPTPVALCKPPGTASVGAILRGKRPVFPKNDDTLNPGDHVVIVARTKDEARTRAYFMERVGDSATEGL